MEKLTYCVALPDDKKKSLIAYSDPMRVNDPYFIYGNATIGLSEAGAPLVHCHAAIVTAEGAVRGGHIITEESVVGDREITALVTTIDDFQIKQIFDPETNMHLLQPNKL